MYDTLIKFRTYLTYIHTYIHTYILYSRSILNIQIKIKNKSTSRKGSYLGRIRE